jgi:DNA (cytosine-5)-methyltransferase 1
MFSYIGIVERFRPQWLVWENVPGVLSSNRGRDFGTLLGALGKLGYECSFRILDAQWFGLPQRRKRVFLVGNLGNNGNTRKILFESESVFRNFESSKKTKQEIANNIENSITENESENKIIEQNIVGAIDCRIMAQRVQNAQAGHYIVVHGTQDPCVSNIAFALGRNNGRENAIIPIKDANDMLNLSPTRKNGAGWGQPGDPAFTLRTVCLPGVAAETFGVRRLTPRECERLQGFPDDYTKISWGNRSADQCPEGPRYKALGNSMAVPVMKWIGERINKYKNG